MKPPEIRDRLKSTGRTQAALAAHLGKSKDSVSRLLQGHRELGAAELESIKTFFGDVAPTPTHVRLPVFGYAGASGPDRVMLTTSDILDYVEIPAGMVRGDAFGVRIAGGSMYPRLFDGETVIAERGVPPTRNKEVVVELTDDTGLVKEYRGQKDGVLFLWQYNPEQEVRVSLTQVRAMHSAFRWR